MNDYNDIIDLLDREFNVHKREFKIISKYKYNGISVPRVTSIISEMQSDQGLLYYSNYLGFKRIDYKQMLNDAADIGSETHEFIENYIKQNSEYKEPERQEVVNCANAFKDWWKELNLRFKIKVLGEEQSLTCPWFGGTYDLLLEINGKKTLVDFKTSNHITFRYFIQLAAYKYLINYNYNIPLDMCMILRMEKENGTYEIINLDLSTLEDSEFMDYCTYAFFSQVNNYYSLARVKYTFNKLIKYNNPSENIPTESNDREE